MFFRPDVTGIDAISMILGVTNLATLIDWQIHYSLPMVKNHGTWTANKRELKEWREQHAYLFEDRNPKVKRVKIKEPRPSRWGLDSYINLKIGRF